MFIFPLVARDRFVHIADGGFGGGSARSLDERLRTAASKVRFEKVGPWEWNRRYICDVTTRILMTTQTACLRNIFLCIYHKLYHFFFKKNDS